MRDDTSTTYAGEPTLDEKVKFLSQPTAYSYPVDHVVLRETHMSWVFLAGDRVYKLKKPVRFPYLNFSTLARREAACRAELRLNRRLAPDVYLDVIPLVQTPTGLSLGGFGTVVDWLVVMHRLQEDHTLEWAIRNGRLTARQLDRLVTTLTGFYRRTSPVFLSPAVHLSGWRASLAFNRKVLLDPRFCLPAGRIRSIDRVQRIFLAQNTDLLIQRVRERQIVDGHGDLRPEHIFLDDQIRIIDCLEFNPRLRAVDPLDEIAFLALECERLGAAWAGEYIRRRIAPALRGGQSCDLFLFYRCHRAMLRARLAIAHLFEPHPRAREKWPQLARLYLQLAARDARWLAQRLKRRTDR